MYFKFSLIFYVFNIISFNITWSFIHKIFAELLLDDIKIICNYVSYKIDNGKIIDVPATGMSVYEYNNDNGIATLHTLCLSENLI